jgi:hypothetical protein
VRTADRTKAVKRATTVRQSDEVTSGRPPANDREPVETLTEHVSKSAIVTVRKPAKRYTFVPDLVEEELQQRRDAASSTRPPPSYGRAAADEPWCASRGKLPRVKEPLPPSRVLWCSEREGFRF